MLSYHHLMIASKGQPTFQWLAKCWVLLDFRTETSALHGPTTEDCTTLHTIVDPYSKTTPLKTREVKISLICWSSSMHSLMPAASPFCHNQWLTTISLTYLGLLLRCREPWDIAAIAMDSGASSVMCLTISSSWYLSLCRSWASNIRHRHSNISLVFFFKWLLDNGVIKFLFWGGHLGFRSRTAQSSKLDIGWLLPWIRSLVVKSSAANWRATAHGSRMEVNAKDP